METKGAPVFIVKEIEVLNQHQIRHQPVRLADLAFQNSLEAIQWLARRRLLRNSVLCEVCQVPMSFTKRSQLSDGFVWKCKDCDSRISIRKDSFFGQKHLSLQQILIVVYGWSRNYSQEDIAHEAGISRVSKHTMVDWGNFCRDVCEQHLIDHPAVIGGLNEDGTSKVVEIDECKFFHRIYHQGKWPEGHWVFGGIERGTGKCFLVEVPDRTAKTLLRIIHKYILPGTIIVSEGWRACNQMNEIGGGMYEHQVVVHEENFIDSIDGEVHTQNTENMWMRIKWRLRKHFGTSEELFESYLHEFVWRNEHKDSNLFSEFLICVQRQYQF